MGQTKQQQRHESKHVRIYKRQMASLAWRHLSPSAVKTLLALGLLEGGDNNGGIYFSDRTGAEMTGLNRKTVRGALQELEATGFIYCTERGSFDRKTPHAACYGLTWVAGPAGTKWRAPSNAYLQWSPNGNTRAQDFPDAGPILTTGLETPFATGPNFGPVEMETPLVSNNPAMVRIGPQTVYQGVEDRGAGNGNREHPLSTVDPRSPFPDRLRLQQIDHLKKSAAGEQSQMASAVGCPGGTLSKFIAGRSLPQNHSARLAQELTRRAATRPRKAGAA